MALLGIPKAMRIAESADDAVNPKPRDSRKLTGHLKQAQMHFSRNSSKMADFLLEDEAIQKCPGLSEDKSTDEKLGNIHCKSKCCANYERFATIS